MIPMFEGWLLTRRRSPAGDDAPARPHSMDPEAARDAGPVQLAGGGPLDALGQQFVAADPYPYDWHYYEHGEQLQWLSAAYASERDISESLRCALDLLELGAWGSLLTRQRPARSDLHSQMRAYEPVVPSAHLDPWVISALAAERNHYREAAVALVLCPRAR